MRCIACAAAGVLRGRILSGAGHARGVARTRAGAGSRSMALTTKLMLKQGQQLVMTPQLQQAIRLLQLSNLELNQFVEGELERNPLLELEETADAAPKAERENDAEAPPPKRPRLRQPTTTGSTLPSPSRRRTAALTEISTATRPKAAARRAAGPAASSPDGQACASAPAPSMARTSTPRRSSRASSRCVII